MRFIKTTKKLIRDDNIPKWLKGMALFGVAPVPGPFDEIVLIIVGVIVTLFYRAQFMEAWNA